MTMQTINGIPVEVVEPGATNDPFSVNHQVASPPVIVASPAAPAEPVGAPAAVPAEGPKLIQANAPVATPRTPDPAVAPVVAPTSLPTPADETPYQKAVREGTVDAYIAEQIRTAAAASAETARRDAQSANDKRIAALEAKLTASQEAARKAERDAALNNEDLSDEDKVFLRRKYDQDDREAGLDAREAQVETYFKAVLVANLVQEKAQYGVTASALEAFTEPEEMTAYVTEKELEFYRNGGAVATPTTVIASGAPVASAPPVQVNTLPAPAGATAPSDLGGSAALAAPVTLSKDLGIDAVKSNLDKIPWVSVPLGR